MFRILLLACDLNDRRVEDADIVVTAGTAKACGIRAVAMARSLKSGPYRYTIGKAVWTGADERPVQGKLF